MIQIRQFVYVHKGVEETFNEFELQVLPLLECHDGKLHMGATHKIRQKRELSKDQMPLGM